MKHGCLLLLVFLFTIILPMTVQGQFVVKEFDAPGLDSRGLAWDGQYLWCADSNLDSLFQIDPATGRVVHSIFFDFDLTYGGGTTWDGEEAIWVTKVNYFRKLDPQNGQELSNFHCPGG